MIPRRSDQGPLVSVVIPAHNASRTLRETLDSVFAQNYAPLEVVVVDDGSTDDTWKVLASFGDSIRVIRQPQGGIARSRNAGVHAASGPLIALLDADDLCEPDRIATQVEVLRRFPQIVLCSSDFSAFDSNGSLGDSYCGTYYRQCSAAMGGPAARYSHRASIDVGVGPAPIGGERRDVQVYYGSVYGELVHGNFVHPPTVMFRRELLDEVGLFDVDVSIVCEWDWFVKVARVGDLGFIDRPLLRYRRSATQISANWRTSLDSLQVARRICGRDPSLYAREPGRFRRHFGHLSLDAASACVEHDRWKALRLLIDGSLRYRTLHKSMLRTLAKAVLPEPLRERVRRLRAS